MKLMVAALNFVPQNPPYTPITPVEHLPGPSAQSTSSPLSLMIRFRDYVTRFQAYVTFLMAA